MPINVIGLVKPVIKMVDPTAPLRLASASVYTVPADKNWKILGGNVGLVTTATGGFRQFRININDNSGSPLLIESWDAADRGAPSMTYGYFLAPSLRGDYFVDPHSDSSPYQPSHIYVPFNPNLMLPAGWQIQIYDFNSIDAAGDGFTTRIQVAESDA